MNICASQSAPFVPTVEDIGVACPAPLHWARAPSPSCCECWLWMVFSFPSGELPSTKGWCLTWKGTNPTIKQPKVNDWLTLTDTGPLLQGGNNFMVQFMIQSLCHVHQAKARSPGTTLLLSSFYFPSSFPPFLIDSPASTLTVNHIIQIPVSSSASMELNLKQLHEYRST